MERVTGIGGIFFRAMDPAKLGGWYREHLGMDVKPDEGAAFRWRDVDEPAQIGTTIWSAFPTDTDYFGPGEGGGGAQRFMINYRVRDLDAMLEQLRRSGATIDPKRADYDFGRFAWVTDPEGNRFELWESKGETPGGAGS